MLPLKINTITGKSIHHNYTNYYYYTVEQRRDDQELHQRSSRHSKNRTRSGLFGRTVTMKTQSLKCLYFGHRQIHIMT